MFLFGLGCRILDARLGWRGRGFSFVNWIFLFSKWILDLHIRIKICGFRFVVVLDCLQVKNFTSRDYDNLAPFWSISRSLS